jgi:hypothetical protein
MRCNAHQLNLSSTTTPAPVRINTSTSCDAHMATDDGGFGVCSKYFQTPTAIGTHEKTKAHKKRIKELKGVKPHMQHDAERAAGMVRPTPPPACPCSLGKQASEACAWFPTLLAAGSDKSHICGGIRCTGQGGQRTQAAQQRPCRRGDAHGVLKGRRSRNVSRR